MSRLDSMILDWLEKEKPALIQTNSGTVNIVWNDQKIAGNSIREAVCEAAGFIAEHALEREVHEMLQAGGPANQMVAAIKHVRTVTGMGLKEAKDMVDRIRDHGPRFTKPILNPEAISPDIPSAQQIDTSKPYSW